METNRCSQHTLSIIHAPIWVKRRPVPLKSLSFSLGPIPFPCLSVNFFSCFWQKTKHLSILGLSSSSPNLNQVEMLQCHPSNQEDVHQHLGIQKRWLSWCLAVAYTALEAHDDPDLVAVAKQQRLISSCSDHPCLWESRQSRHPPRRQC